MEKKTSLRLGKKQLLLIGTACLSMLVFLLQYSVALPHENSISGYGKTDYAVYYMAGNAILGKGNVSPQDLYDRRKTVVELKEIRKVKGGNRFIYLPPAALFFTPLSTIKFALSYQFWLAINPLLMIAGYYLSIYLLAGDKNIWKLRYSAILLSLSFSPVISTSIGTGQINSVLWVAFILGFYALYKKNHASAAFAFVFTTLFKFFPILFGLYAILKKQWRTVWYSLGIGVSLIAISLFFFGWEAYWIFLTFIIPKLASGEMWDLGGSSILGAIVYAKKDGFFALFDLSKSQIRSIMPIIQWVITIPILSITGYLLLKYRNTHTLSQYLFEYSLIMLVMLLVPQNTHAAFHIWLFPLVLFLVSLPLRRDTWLPLSLGILSVILLFFRNVTNLLQVPYIRLETVGLLLLFFILCLILLPIDWKRPILRQFKALNK